MVIAPPFHRYDFVVCPVNARWQSKLDNLSKINTKLVVARLSDTKNLKTCSHKYIYQVEVSTCKNAFDAMELLSFYLLCFCSLLPSSFLRLLDEMGPAMLMAVPVLLLLPPTTSNPQPTNPQFPKKDHFYFSNWFAYSFMPILWS